MTVETPVFVLCGNYDKRRDCSLAGFYRRVFVFWFLLRVFGIISVMQVWVQVLIVA